MKHLVKNLEENDFYYLSWEFNPNALDLLKKKNVSFPVITGIALKNLKKAYSAKINFIIY